MWGLMPEDDVQHSISETATISKMFIKTVTEVSKLHIERQERIYHNRYFYLMSWCTLRPLEKQNEIFLI